jgi:hypothetical protein
MSKKEIEAFKAVISILKESDVLGTSPRHLKQILESDDSNRIPQLTVATKLFLVEFVTYIEYQFGLKYHYDSLFSYLIYTFAENIFGTKEYFTKAETTYINEKCKNRKHWLHHYRMFAINNYSRMEKPKVTIESLKRIKQIAHHYAISFNHLPYDALDKYLPDDPAW